MTAKTKYFVELVVGLAEDKGLTASELHEAANIIKNMTEESASGKEN